MARPNNGNAKTDWYQEITNTVVEAMEEALTDGRAWQKCWQGMWAHGLPHNGLTTRPYNGLNIWLLALKGHSDPRWFTFNQAKEAVGYKRNPAWKGRNSTYQGIQKWIWKGEGEDPRHGVRKGEKGTKVFFWRFIRVYEDANGKEVRKPTKAQIKSGAVRLVKSFPMLKVYTVFNAEQITGLPEMEVEDVDLGAKYIRAQALLDILDIDLQHVKGSDRACYRPGDDRIQLPAPGQFDSVEHYWSTAMHEVTHWTGHSSRLDRNLSDRFGGDAYAMEELIAELGSAFLCAHLGIEGELRHPEYLAAWIKRLGEDKYAIFKAASLAQKAVDFIIDGGVAETAESEDEDTGASEAVAKAA